MTFDPIETARVLFLCERARQDMQRIMFKASVEAAKYEPGTVEFAAQQFIWTFAGEEFDRHNAVLERHATGSTLQ